MSSEKPYSIRLGIQKKYLERIVFKDHKYNTTPELIKDKMEEVILADPELRDEYLKELQGMKKVA